MGAIITSERQGGVQVLERMGFVRTSERVGNVVVTGIRIDAGGGGIPADAVLHEDGTQVFYEDGVYLKYVA